MGKEKVERQNLQQLNLQNNLIFVSTNETYKLTTHSLIDRCVTFGDNQCGTLDYPQENY